jgi:signal transduction histidine kinase
VLSTFAAQAAVAIENARLFTLTDEALADRVAELSIMQEIDRQINQNLDFSNVMALTLEWATRITQARNGAIGLIDLEEAETQVVAQHGPDPARVIALLQDGIGVGGDWEITVPIQREGHVSGVVALDRADNKAFSEESRAFLVRLTDHAAVAIENARLYQQVQEANQAKTDFVHVVTHELRAPMTTIKGYADMIAMSSDLDDKQKRFLAIIRSSVERMSTLVSDLSDISRIESGKLNIEIEPHITIDECLNRVLDQLRGQIDERGHQIKTELAKGLPAVQADPKRVDQVLTNLISNAYKYTPNNGTITVSARKEGHFVRVAVSDTGVGMTPQELNRLFTKFWRADDLHVREQPGTGLGLTITKNLIEMQGGQLTVESAKGEGTTFSFTLPVSAG